MPLHAALLGVAVWALLPRLARADRRVLAAIAALFVGGVAWILVVPVSVEDMLPIREGFSLDHLRMVVGHDNDTGSIVYVLWRTLLHPGPPTYRGFVQVNRFAVLGWSTLVLLVAASSRRSLLVALVGLGGGGGIVAATTHTELNAGTAGLYLTVGALLLYAGTDESSPLARRRLARVGVLIVALFLPSTREELMAFSTAAVASVVLWQTGLEAMWTVAWDRLGAQLRARPWIVPLGVLAWCVASRLIYEAGPGHSGEMAWLFAAFNPWNVYGLTMGAVWPAVLPVGVCLLALRGAWLAGRVPMRTAFAPIVFWVVYGTLRMAAHGASDLYADVMVARWELYRYILPFTPVVLLLSQLGALDEELWVTLHELGKDVPLGARWLVAVCLAFPWPWMAHLMHTAPDGAPEWPDGLHPVTQSDAMMEVRALIQRSERQPACALLVPGWTWRGEPDPARFEWAVLAPGDRGLRWVPSHLPGSTPPAEVLQRTAPDAVCAAVWRSMDCAQQKSPGCDWTSALVPAGDVEVRHVPMDHPTHGGVWPATYTVGFYGIPGVPTEAAE